MRTRWTALWAALAASAVLAGCQSATKTNLAEYESLVARRRNPAPSATPMAVRAAQEKAEAEARAAEARAREAEARAKKAEAEAAAAKEKAAAAEKAAARRAEEKTLAERKAEAERDAAKARKAADADRKAQEAAEKEVAKQAAKEAQRRAAEDRKAAEKRAEEERKAREAAEREAASAVEVVAPPQTALPAGRSETPIGGNTAYVLAVGDAVQIILRGIPGGEAIEDIIDEGGYVTLPFINEVKAAGCTATQLEKIIRDTYRERRIYKDLSVQVMVPTRFYYMQGEIRGPGRVQLVSAVRLSQAIAANGGGTEFWNGKVVVKRNDGRVVNVKNARRLERTPEDDILLEPGDIVELKRGWL